MTVALVSDAHGAVRNMDVLLEALPPVDALCFLGDMDKDGQYLAYGMEEKQPKADFFAVAGNNDPFSQLPKTQVLAFGGVQVLITHGHLFHGVRSSRRTLATQAKRLGCALALYGHTHVPADECIAEVRCVNPGALMQGEYALLQIAGDALQITFCTLL